LIVIRGSVPIYPPVPSIRDRDDRGDALVAPLAPMTDGVVTIRAPGPGDGERLVAGGDDEWHRWLGPGDDQPSPTACIVVAGEVVGWVDADPDAAHVRTGAVNVGYNVFPRSRRNGYAARAVELLIRHLRERTSFHTAILSIDAGNEASLAVATRTGFTLTADGTPENLVFERAVQG
jgi:L-amino acid N-acyltransferase YncA